MTPRIGILTYAGDPHGYVVKTKIEEQHNAWCGLIPCDELTIRGGITWSSQMDAPCLLPNVHGGTIDVRTLNALWVRRVSGFQTLPEGIDAAHELHIRSSMEKALEGLLVNEFKGRWVSHPVASRLAENKLLQLRAAQKAGVRIPATLVSQHPEQIRSFCAAYPGAIIKPVSTPRGVEFVSTAVVSQELLENDDSLGLAPTIYQECVPGGRHLRISVIGERCDAALIESEILDWRTDLTIPFSRYPLGDDLQRRLQVILRELGLAMGVFDLKLIDNDEPVFLEVNPQGQFLFVEALAEISLADQVAAFLADQAMQDLSSREGAGLVARKRDQCRSA